MAKGKRWEYLKRINRNNFCESCNKKVKIYFIGSKTKDGIRLDRYECEFHHTWTVEIPQIDLNLPGGF